MSDHKMSLEEIEQTLKYKSGNSEDELALNDIIGGLCNEIRGLRKRVASLERGLSGVATYAITKGEIV